MLFFAVLIDAARLAAAWVFEIVPVVECAAKTVHIPAAPFMGRKWKKHPALSM
jgi:hypothetical protein